MIRLRLKAALDNFISNINWGTIKGNPNTAIIAAFCFALAAIAARNVKTILKLNPPKKAIPKKGKSFTIGFPIRAINKIRLQAVITNISRLLKISLAKTKCTGEFSHIPLFDNNKLCSCGKYGCLETETSLMVVAQKAIKQLQEQETPTLLTELDTADLEDAAKKIIEAAQKGDKFSIELLSEAAYHIGRGVAFLIHILNPELVVMSGIGSLAGKVWIAPIQQAINEHCIPRLAENTKLEISSLGYNAELIGAAALVMDNYEKLSSIFGTRPLTVSIP